MTSALAAAYPRGCAYSRSQRVGNGIQVNDANKCTYGWEVDACGNQICTKGPGEVCGGKGQRYGVCGEGLVCSNCNRCQGCSLRTYECFDDPKCIWSAPMEWILIGKKIEEIFIHKYL